LNLLKEIKSKAKIVKILIKTKPKTQKKQVNKQTRRTPLLNILLRMSTLLDFSTIFATTI
jgi:hypothetical protein